MRAAGEKSQEKDDLVLQDLICWMINKFDLAPLVEADLSIMESDAKRMRQGRPFVFTNLKTEEEWTLLSDGLRRGIRRCRRTCNYREYERNYRWIYKVKLSLRTEIRDGFHHLAEMFYTNPFDWWGLIKDIRMTLGWGIRIRVLHQVLWLGIFMKYLLKVKGTNSRLESQAYSRFTLWNLEGLQGRLP